MSARTQHFGQSRAVGLTLPDGLETQVSSHTSLKLEEQHAISRNGTPYSFAQTWLFAGLLAFVVARLWIVPLRDGFWIDETGSVWAVQGGLKNILARCTLWPSQSPAYSLIVWLMYKIKGPNEFLIRLPSLLAMGAAAYLIYRLAVRLVGREAGWPSAIAFASFGAVAFAAGDARPYAFATLCVVAATWLLVRWFDRGHFSDAFGYCLLASLSIYMHFLFGSALLVHLAYGLYRSRSEQRISILKLISAAVAIAALLIPFVFHMLALMRTAQSHSFAGTPTLVDYFTLLAPPMLVGSVLGILFLFFLAGKSTQFSVVRLETSSLLLIAAWALVPMTLLYLTSVFTSLKVFIPRYTLPSEAGLALLAGWLLSSISAAKVRLAAVSAAVLATLAAAPPAAYSHGGDWRAAMASVRANANPDTPVLVRAVFPEAEPFNWLQDESRKSYLFAPLGIYPAAGKVIPLPTRPNDASSTYLESVIPQLEQVDRFLVVSMGDSAYQNWLQGRLAPEGFSRRRAGGFGGSLTVDIYQRSTDNHAAQR